MLRTSDPRSAFSVASLLPPKASPRGNGRWDTPGLRQVSSDLGEGRADPQKTVKSLPFAHPAGRISVRKPALGLLGPKRGNLPPARAARKWQGVYLYVPSTAGNTKLARHVSAVPWGSSASAALRPAASRRMFLTNALWSGSDQAKFAFSTTVVSGEFKEISLDDFKGKYLVLFFYPLDFTFVCPTEIIAFSDKANEFHDVNCEVVAVSISRDYGVLLEGPGLALRGLFIIDPNGVIKHLSVNDLPVGRSVEETLRLVKAFQFVETHGEVCPANWTPESPTVGFFPKSNGSLAKRVPGVPGSKLGLGAFRYKKPGREVLKVRKKYPLTPMPEKRLQGGRFSTLSAVTDPLVFLASSPAFHGTHAALLDCMSGDGDQCEAPLGSHCPWGPIQYHLSTGH
ncbi:PRDX3 [Cervus elaphus hippelaphus]|uniref:Thioredoxin-dependent peroxide reductase, mitochondrial n=1 Tax=Cervus elaphus hippelaphus TaxID=46360 RepID=A0A212CNQ0_CEREH|nr:PRDX3 [Cervus elaphus hippelaphus]